MSKRKVLQEANPEDNDLLDCLHEGMAAFAGSKQVSVDADHMRRVLFLASVAVAMANDERRH